MNGAGHDCSYYSFKFEHRREQSTSHMLRSLAYQTALHQHEFRRALVNLAKKGACLSEADSKTIWRIVFKSILATIKTEQRIIWVIDGPDEAESSTQAVEYLSAVADLNTHMLRVLVLSRPLASIHNAFQVAREKMSVMETPLPDNQDDIRLSVANKLDGLVCGDQRKLKLVEEIVARSQGSFLWASLVGQAVVGKTREGQIQQALESTPSGMGRLYDRMMATIMALNMDEDKQLAKALMTCAMFAKAPITVGEFSELYPSETKGIMSFRHTVEQVCGQFVILTHDERVQLVHHSAREYLMRTKETPFPLDPRGANEDMLVKCLGALCDKTLRQKVTTLSPPEFPQYSSTFWPGHLQEVAVDSARALKALVTFFDGPYPLTWIQYLAKTSRLSELPVASRKLSEFLQKYTKADGPESMLSRRLEDVSLLQSWAVDLMMLPAKFGPYLLVDPTSIYKHIPALCPMACAINQKFSAGPDARLAVSGLSGEYWGDCLARISPGGDTIRRLAVSSLYLAVASQTIISIYGTVLYEERSIIASEGNILDLAFNNSGSLLAVCTATRTTVYTTSGWSLILCTENPRFCGAAIELSLDKNDSFFAIFGRKEVHKLSIHDPTENSVWSPVGQDAGLLQEQGIPGGSFATPSVIRFNSDCTLIAVAYDNLPLSVWSVEPAAMITRLKREGRPGCVSFHSDTGSNSHAWHPSGDILGTHGERVFKWDHVTDRYESIKGEMTTGIIRVEITCGLNGHVFGITYPWLYNIYNFATMSTVYRVAPIGIPRCLRFSPNEARVYTAEWDDHCSVWEPRCLQGLADTAPVGSFEAGVTGDSPGPPAAPPLSGSSALLDYLDSLKRVTGLAVGCSSGDPYAYATSDGRVFLYDPPSKRTCMLASSTHRISRFQLSWSSRQDLLAYGTRNFGPIRVIKSSSGSERWASVETVLTIDMPLGSGQCQFLLNPAGNRLFVARSEMCQVLMVPEGTKIAETTVPHGDRGRWQQHPRNPEHLVCLAPSHAITLSWDKLEQKKHILLDILRVVADDRLLASVDLIRDSHSQQHAILQTIDSRKSRGYCVLPAESIYSLPTASRNVAVERVVSPLELPPLLVRKIKHGFGILPEGVLVFLDQMNWVCTIPLSSPTEELREFFLPSDWATTEDLRLSRLLSDGTLLCPTGGQVAILKYAWRAGSRVDGAHATPRHPN
ncbi:hypothetical protein GGTG_00817 [Gaeumannomyces tritici R3-111a-1]|uniref:NACHT domain-containing protein n=1 Tax=Gaeumannomyces tritici (strain R3-111a-1) TaxID=644352 RepID=J3NHT0_GAET3|nr:hypothetical protein GGTG_00817 [Gaeumannomyces tritici R3-111a-1]EJT80823.1 hypothetical protein GGTG_00817 [Gaeumannomyces tritici R3-111a-1]